MKNHLADEKSPYLLQHANNPVDWYPWGEEAFNKAKKEDKPIFLSIGYSTCHWCHVMAHESFEDRKVARLMNDVFVSIKVDREERPDIDNLYMSAAHMMIGTGGWPLNLILTPDGKPFFAATYIPKNNRFGRSGMLELIPHIKRIWKGERERVLNSSEEVTESLKSMENHGTGDELSASSLHSAFRTLYHSFDSENGGFGRSPKFPSSHTFLFLLRYWKRTGEQRALDMVEKTLWSMRFGGIFDHLGYGFHRYSTDERWLLPHFEKMLYDQAMISMACLETYQATKNPSYARIAQEIFTYVTRDMQSPEGGFYSAEDADSEGEEGKYYLWTVEEVRSVLSTEELEVFVKEYNMEEEGNYRDEATGKLTGKNVLHRDQTSDLEDDLEQLLVISGEKLFSERNKRIKPGKDDKILTDWNGLMIASLARGAHVLKNKELLKAAEDAFDFILEKMRNDEGELLHRYRDGSAGIAANLDDHAFLTWASLELYESSFDHRYLEIALKMNQDMMDRFLDKENGGFYFTPKDGESLIVRKKELHDGAMPSGYSVATSNMLKLARITGNMVYDSIAQEALNAYSRRIKRNPNAHLHTLSALEFALGPTWEIVIVGEKGSKETMDILDSIRCDFLPRKVVMLKDSDALDRISKSTKDFKTMDGKTTAYVCSEGACNKPTTDIREFMELLHQG